MAYFDSAKNRVLWQRALTELRAERERREKQGYVPDRDRPGKAQEKHSSGRVPITFSQLEQEVLAASRGEKAQTGKGAVRRREKSKSQEPLLKQEKEISR